MDAQSQRVDRQLITSDGAMHLQGNMSHVFMERKALILASHDVERRYYESRPWENRIDV